jgi:hypothetical protein
VRAWDRQERDYGGQEHNSRKSVRVPHTLMVTEGNSRSSVVRH